MAKLLVLILAVSAVLAVVEGKKSKSCERRIKRFERCLERGYKCKGGCVSGEGKLKKRAWKKCRKLEKKISKKCDYIFEKSMQPEPIQVEQVEQLILILEECGRNVTRLVGQKLQSLHPSTYEDCRIECSRNPDCKGFNFYNQAEYGYEEIDIDLECELLSEIREIDVNFKVRSAIKKCNRTAIDLSCVEEQTRYYPIDEGKYTIGEVLVDPVKGTEDCAMMCRDLKNCKSLSHEKTYHDCTLYSDAPGEPGSQMKTISEYGHNSMTMNCN